MAEVWTEQVIMARYHLRVFDRLIEYYEESPEKRFFIGALNELSRAAANLINAILMQAESAGQIKIVKSPEKNLRNFRGIASEYLDSPEIIFEILKIKGDHKKSPVQFDRGGEVLFVIEGKYKVLTLNKLKDLSKGLSSSMAEVKVI